VLDGGGGELDGGGGELDGGGDDGRGGVAALDGCAGCEAGFR
jgi:hypothetical protein